VTDPFLQRVQIIYGQRLDPQQSAVVNDKFEVESLHCWLSIG
jgi:hypothetical protein